ncbi:hypothetical protein BRADI_2g38828v3 [Brachypodium distachyon]|uniref:NB-ARC domain-containing protein n=1 Tax=Brachypodium distachyon TaxID=15368 RepID=A0A2K2DCN5_BRADI|nr:hypothetical protein BRADI_2g38828v3 [Brachypodium distachyon]PNT72041.1 hypothetical protein BRADI_2g38828v3 [Brachypodium distachyon]PNT72042.1 hypothetical protein BRADI_2g38828v3 [Brachypodium distachyon]
MEATVVSLGKAGLDGALGYARSKAAEEVALQLGVEGDVSFIADELEMMQSFLMTADEELGQHKVLATWVKQVRDVAYNVEDSLMDFTLYSEKKASWWCSLHTMGERLRIAKEVKELRAKVEDVSNRNLRYRLIKARSGSKTSAAEEQASIATAAMFGINEARLADLEKEKSNVDLHQLITSEEEELRVVTIWGTGGDLGKTSAIKEVYDDPKVLKKFGFRAWVRLTHPFNPKELIQCFVRQFYEKFPEKHGETWKRKTTGVNFLMKMENMSESEMIDVFDAQVSDNSYLIVIDDLSTIVEWSCIKNFFPDNRKQSRIIVSTQQVEIASLCTEKPYQVSVFKQLSSDQTLYLFHQKVIPASSSDVPISDSIKATTAKTDRPVPTNEIQEEDQEPKDAGRGKDSASTDGKKFHRSRTMTLTDEMLTGRVTDKSTVIGLIDPTRGEGDCKVISVWGMGGLGKTTLVRIVYRSPQLSGWKQAWATALRPFNPEVLIRSLVLQLQKDIQEDPAGATATGKKKENIAVMKLLDLKEELNRLLNTQKCLIVLDDISSTAEWDLVKNCLQNARRVIVTTREKNIAKHCSGEYKNMYSLQGLKDDDALELFKIKVFKDNGGNIDLVPEMMKQARLVLKKCDGLPLAISTIGGFLASKPKTAVEWRKMNDHISSELEINPELRTLKSVLMRSYDGLPYHLKSAFLYLSIFPEDHKIRWDRLVRRWIAEGYSRDMHGMTGEELGRRYFDELLDRSMILPGNEVNHYSGKIKSCQLHDMIREIGITKVREENLVFTLEEGFCLSSTQGAI